jgi:hypothetical protein
MSNSSNQPAKETETSVIMRLGGPLVRHVFWKAKGDYIFRPFPIVYADT